MAAAAARSLFLPPRLALLRRLSTAASDSTASRLAAIVGADAVSTGESVRSLHGRDQSYLSGDQPDVVVFPTSVQQVVEICRLCHSDALPVIAFGAGTGVEGGVSAPVGGVCVDLMRMDAVVEYEPRDMFATVEPGVTRQKLDAMAKQDGLWFPVDPSVGASICGMCATGASGTNAVRFGTIKENTLNLQVVLADGNVIETSGIGKRSRKSSAGYNLTELILGSEGTLGIITKATVRLHALPGSIAVATVSFPDILAAVNTVVDVMQSAIPIARIELLDEITIQACNAYSGTTFPLLPTLFLELHGHSASSVREQTDVLSELAVSRGGLGFEWASAAEARTKLWKARSDVYWALERLRPGVKHFSTDVCVPVTKLPEIIAFSREEAEKSGILAPIVGHVGDGNFHAMLFFSTPAEYALATSLSERMARKSLSMGGTVTGEHGIGVAKMDLLERQFGPDGMAMMAAVKKALDPKGIMNPGKVIKRITYKECASNH